MPTGYTAKVQDGKITEVKDYILGCARNFGALIHMRDDNLDTEIRHKKPDYYYLRTYNKSLEELEKFKKLTDEEIQKTLDEDYENALKNNEVQLKRMKDEKQRYLNMIEKVNNWEPPTEEHINLKTFALNQLQISLESDCSDRLMEYYSEKPIKPTVEEYKKVRLIHLEEEILYYKKNYEENIKTVNEVNKWIDDLIDSFK